MTLSASSFQDPLLRVLLDLTGSRAGIPVKASDTYEPVMALMGITDINAHGTYAPTGVPQVQRWIQDASTNLRRTGQTEGKGRGKWALTKDGLEAATHLSIVAGDAEADDESVTSTDTTLVAARQTMYHEDPYVIEVASNSVSCFGAFSTHGAAICGDCPLSVSCRNRMYGLLSRMAEALAAKAETDDVNPDDMARDDGDTSTGTPAQDFDWSDLMDQQKAEMIRLQASAHCEACGEEIAAGEKVMWVAGTGKEAGVYHTTCGMK